MLVRGATQPDFQHPFQRPFKHRCRATLSAGTSPPVRWGARSWTLSLKGSPNLGVIFLEDTNAGFHDAKGVAAVARAFRTVVAGSEWTREVLARRFGSVAAAAPPPRLRVAYQGVDPEAFPLAPPTTSEGGGDRFVIFTGGKLEWRKGQDVMVAALRLLVDELAPEVDWHLVAAWHTDYARFMTGLDAAGEALPFPRSRRSRFCFLVFFLSQPGDGLRRRSGGSVREGSGEASPRVQPSRRAPCRRSHRHPHPHTRCWRSILPRRRRLPCRPVPTTTDALLTAAFPPEGTTRQTPF